MVGTTATTLLSAAWVVITVAVRSMEHLEGLLNRLAPQSGDTITAMVLSTPVPNKVVTRELIQGEVQLTNVG